MPNALTGFDWDIGNRLKCQKHGVSLAEIESLFERPLTVLPDAGHSTSEERLRAIGKTSAGRHVFLVFTIRERAERSYIRPISARYMHKMEIAHYEQKDTDVQER
jgi:uncharacterized DUF497 family protein